MNLGMNIAIVCFTERGSGILRKLQSGMSELSYNVTADYPLKEPLRNWVSCHFKTGGGLIFVGAAGIAVRSVAPLLEGKDTDPAVVVVDEFGRFSISLLSGHLGGANDLARIAAGILGAVPVITTATDLNHSFAVDLFAQDNGLAIQDFTAAKEISAAVLRKEKIGFFSEFPVEGETPFELAVEEEREWTIYITVWEHDLIKRTGQKLLRLAAPAVVLGIGCRRGIPVEIIEAAVERVLKEYRINRAAVVRIASIDLKKSEQGLLQLAKRMKAEFVTYTAEELEQVNGTFTESEFVRQVTGVSNVCERAALCGCCGPGRLAVKKTAADGVTVAVAIRDMRVYF